LYLAADAANVFLEGPLNSFNKLSNKPQEFPHIDSHHLGEQGVNGKIILE